MKAGRKVVRKEETGLKKKGGNDGKIKRSKKKIENGNIVRQGNINTDRRRAMHASLHLVAEAVTDTYSMVLNGQKREPLVHGIRCTVAAAASCLLSFSADAVTNLQDFA